MIAQKSRSLEWIREAATKNHAPDIILVEKTIRAFSLLESLALSGLDFCFKGGSSLMLHFDSSKRLSIDVDIICKPGTDIRDYLGKYSREYGFNEVELVSRKSRTNVPKTHAKYYYEVSYLTNTSREKILLDVLYEDIHYNKLEDKAIRSPFLLTEGEDVFVKVPSASDLLGDKLTAFAPHTTGIPFWKGEKNCSMEVIKQLFDIASLFDVVDDFGAVSDTFTKLATLELAYRDREDISVKEVLQDTINAGLCIASKGKLNEDDYKQYIDGSSRIRGFIHSTKYSIDQAVTDSAKAAYLAAFDLQYVCTYTFKGEGKDEAEALAKADESARALFESSRDKTAEEAMKILNALCAERTKYADQIKSYNKEYKLIITPGFSISRKTKNVFEDVTIGDIDFTDARFEVRGGQNYSPEM